MKLFDLHCDTAGECFKRKTSLLSNNMHISLEKGRCLDRWSQLFAVWIPDESRGKEAEKYFESVCAYFLEQVKNNESSIKLCKTGDDYFSAAENGQCAAFLTVEGASAVCSNAMLQKAVDYGVKLVTLTWNMANEIACGCQCEEDGGFTPKGRAFVKELQQAGIIADVSHLGRKSFYELMSMETDVPVVASHSNSASVLLATRRESEDREFSERRLLTDEQIKLLIERKSLIGLNFCNSFLGDEGDDGFAAVCRHARHILELGGENALCIGSDFDGCEINKELAGLDKTVSLYAYMKSDGFSDELLDKIFYDNAEKFFVNVLQNK